MSSAAANEAAAVDQLARIGRKVREAVLATLPCAFEQYVTLSMPGLVIDTTTGGPYISEGPLNAGRRRQLNVNEARLVDSMVPLDNIMLGPTGKSVARSYLTALDFLVPRSSDIGLFSKKSNNETASKYTEAMDYLKSKVGNEAVYNGDAGYKNNVATEGTASAGAGAATDFQGTRVGRYVKKQLAWAQAQGEWDAIRDEAEEDLTLRPDDQTAANTKERNKLQRQRKAELHARWMDWVVNGDKLHVDHYFAIVDRSDLMVRVENAKQATRDAYILDSRDGTDWPRVFLEPEGWATICQHKAEDWANRNPVNIELVEMELSRLKQMKLAYEGYSEWTKTSRAQETDFVVGTYNHKEWNAKEKTLKKAVTDAEAAPTKDEATIKAAQAAYDKHAKEHPQEKLRFRLEGLNAKSTALIAAKELPDDDQGKPTAKKTEEIAKAEKELSAAKEEWKKADAAFREYQVKVSVQSDAQARADEMKTGAESDKQNIILQIKELEKKLAEGRKTMNTFSARDTVIGVDPRTNELLHPDPVSDGSIDPVSVKKQGGDGRERSAADPWTKVTFSTASSSSSTDSSSFSFSSEAHVKYSSLFTSVEASNSDSYARENVKKAMANCTINGSFEALLVNIRRPWLHADLFNDYEIDATSDLSPGAAQLKTWIATQTSENRKNMSQYNQFPAYPTAFIVAANTTLNIQCGESAAETMSKSFSTDSSLDVNVGCWNIGGGAHLKTDSKNSNQRMEVKNGALSISFQAPQIIGWVSEILPELPRKSEAGGLTAAPGQVFRAKI